MLRPDRCRARLDGGGPCSSAAERPHRWPRGPVRAAPDPEGRKTWEAGDRPEFQASSHKDQRPRSALPHVRRRRHRPRLFASDHGPVIAVLPDPRTPAIDPGFRHQPGNIHHGPQLDSTVFVTGIVKRDGRTGGQTLRQRLDPSFGEPCAISPVGRLMPTIGSFRAARRLLPADRARHQNRR